MGRPKIRSNAEIKQYQRDYATKNPEKLREAKARYRDKNRELLAMKDRLRRHGLTQEQYEAIYVAQEGLCAICEVPFEGLDKIHVDHNHDTGEIRGLLCLNCNWGLGQFKDSPRILIAAMRYLEGEL